MNTFGSTILWSGPHPVEADYEKFLSKSRAFMIPLSATPTDIDDFSNKIVLTYGDAIASLFDKSHVMNLHTNHAGLWKKVARGLLLDCISKTISVDLQAKYQLDKRMTRQEMMNTHRTVSAKRNNGGGGRGVATSRVTISAHRHTLTSATTTAAKKRKAAAEASLAKRVAASGGNVKLPAFVQSNATHCNNASY